MKQGKPVITFAMLSIAVALCLYFGFYIFDTFNDPFTTTLAYHYTAYDSVEADGLLVRQEQVLPAQGGIVDVTCSEGEKVGVGQTVALVYRDVQAQSDQAELGRLEMEIELLEYAANQGRDAGGSARLDEDILQSIVALRSAAALDDYSQLEEQVLTVKSSVLKRGYTYGDGLTTADLTARLQQLRSQRTALSGQAATATTRVVAQASGVFSSQVDGYETVLTPQTVLQLTPDTLGNMLQGSGGTNNGGIGKLITDSRWYFAALVPTQAADRLHQGDFAKLRFTGDFSQDVDMRVDQLGAVQGERQLVVFSSDRYLARTTLLRGQTAQLIFDSWSGLRVPKEALRMVKYTYKDPETEQEREESKLGVYVLLGGRAEFKPVEVVTEGSDYYVVTAASGDTNGLRPGDEVIIQATGLYDGQLLEF